MSHNETNIYDLDSRIAELYDQSQVQAEDTPLIRRLIGSSGPLRILEPFTGTGRILLPLAVDGQTAVGVDQSARLLPTGAPGQRG